MSSPVVFACDMGAITPEQRTTHVETIHELFGAVVALREMPDGYAFHLPSDSALLVRAAEFMALERLCCPFFGFSLNLQAGATSFSLNLTGPDGIKPFIRAEIGPALPKEITFPGSA